MRCSTRRIKTGEVEGGAHSRAGPVSHGQLPDLPQHPLPRIPIPVRR
jgi:hypothetical protein